MRVALWTANDLAMVRATHTELLTPAEARQLAGLLLNVAQEVEDFHAQVASERAPQLRMDCDPQTEMPV